MLRYVVEFQVSRQFQHENSGAVILDDAANDFNNQNQQPTTNASNNLYFYTTLSSFFQRLQHMWTIVIRSQLDCFLRRFRAYFSWWPFMSLESLLCLIWCWLLFKMSITKWLGFQMMPAHSEMLKHAQVGGTPWCRLARIMVTIHSPQNHKKIHLEVTKSAK